MNIPLWVIWLCCSIMMLIGSALWFSMKPVIGIACLVAAIMQGFVAYLFYKKEGKKK